MFRFEKVCPPPDQHTGVTPDDTLRVYLCRIYFSARLIASLDVNIMRNRCASVRVRGGARLGVRVFGND